MQFVVVEHMVHGDMQVVQLLLDDYAYVPFGQLLELTQVPPVRKPVMQLRQVEALEQLPQGKTQAVHVPELL